MQRTPVNSSTIAEIGYDNSLLTLEIAFHNGGSYQYFDVPESEYEALMQSDSKGKYHHANIRNNYRYAKL